MSQTIIFRDLPATFPGEDRFKRPAAIGSVIVHAVILVTVVLIPLIFTSSISNLQTLTYVAAPAPPAPILTATAPVVSVSKPNAAPPRQQTLEPALMTPVVVPDEIARIVDAAPGVTAGVEGGVPGGIVPDALRHILATPLVSTVSTADVPAPVPPPPPPPEPAKPERPDDSPVRLTEFYPLKTIRTAGPVYPHVAKLARIQGTVFLDLTLSTAGKVEEVRIVSGHPLLAKAAVECVRSWIYESPVIDGRAVAVIIPVRLNFRLEL